MRPIRVTIMSIGKVVAIPNWEVQKCTFWCFTVKGISVRYLKYTNVNVVKCEGFVTNSLEWETLIQQKGLKASLTNLKHDWNAQQKDHLMNRFWKGIHNKLNLLSMPHDSFWDFPIFLHHLFHDLFVLLWFYVCLINILSPCQVSVGSCQSEKRL